MSSLDIWVGMVVKPCGSSTRLSPALLSLPILPILHSEWYHPLLESRFFPYTSIPNFIALSLSFPERTSSMPNGQMFLIGCIRDTSISTCSKQNFFRLLLLPIFLGVALVDLVPAGSPAPHLHSRPWKRQRGSVKRAASFDRMRSGICSSRFCSLPLELAWVIAV